MPSIGARRIEDTHHDLFAEQRRAGADAEVDGAVLREPHLDAAVLRHAALGDVEPRHDLEARGDLDGELHGRLRDFLQHAVEAVADAVGLFVRFEVDVRCALLDGVQQHLVDEADDGRVFDVVARDRVAGELVVAGHDIEVLEVEIVLGETRHRRVDLLERLADGLLELVVLDHDGFDAEAGVELDLVDRVQVGRIRDREEQALAASHERQDTVLVQHLVADQLDGLEVDGWRRRGRAAARRTRARRQSRSRGRWPSRC